MFRGDDMNFPQKIWKQLRSDSSSTWVWSPLIRLSSLVWKKKKKTPTLQRTCYDSVRLIAFPAGSHHTRSGSASSRKGRVCFFFFSNLPPGGGCDLLLTCIRYSRGASLPRTTVFQVVNVCHVQVRWFIRCEVDDGSGENVQLSLVRRTVVSAQTDAGKKFRLIYCLFGLCCPPFIW